MFVTSQEVMDVTPYSGITNEDVRQAQFVIELYIGREEADITDPRDFTKIRRAVIAQTVYMKDNKDITFNQISVSSISRGDGMTVFRSGDFTAPFIAPLALMSLAGLSWRRSRSVAVSKIQHDRQPRDWRTE
jgi:hypothetical protein